MLSGGTTPSSGGLFEDGLPDSQLWAPQAGLPDDPVLALLGAPTEPLRAPAPGDKDSVLWKALQMAAKEYDANTSAQQRFRTSHRLLDPAARWTRLSQQPGRLSQPDQDAGAIRPHSQRKPTWTAVPPRNPISTLTAMFEPKSSGDMPWKILQLQLNKLPPNARVAPGQARIGGSDDDDDDDLPDGVCLLLFNVLDGWQVQVRPEPACTWETLLVYGLIEAHKAFPKTKTLSPNLSRYQLYILERDEVEDLDDFDEDDYPSMPTPPLPTPACVPITHPFRLSPAPILCMGTWECCFGWYGFPR